MCSINVFYIFLQDPKLKTNFVEKQQLLIMNHSGHLIITNNAGFNKIKRQVPPILSTKQLSGHKHCF